LFRKYRMRFPYTEVGPGLYRPLVPVRVWGPVGPHLADGLLDCAADRVLLSPTVATRAGIDVAALEDEVTILSASLQPVACRQTRVLLELRRNSRRYCWQAEVAVATQPIHLSLWGLKGFLEYFRTTLDGPRRFARLIAGQNMPKARPPAKT
jgi:hypothetical protein